MMEEKIKRKFRETFLKDSEPSKNLYEMVTEKMNLERKNKRNFKKWISVFTTSLCVLLVAIIAIVIVNGRNVKTYNSIVQLDVNPSIQLVVDQDNKVLSVTGLNDEGKMVIQGEIIIGKNYEEALELIINLETQMGYLSEGSNNKVTITVSAENDELVKKIQDKAEEYVNETLENLGIVATIEKVKGYTTEELKSLAKKLDPTLTEEQINNFDYNQLVNVIKAYHLETMELASVKLEEFYKNFKEYKISFSEKEEVKKAVDNLDAIYQFTFNYAYEQLENAYQLLQENYYEAFINPESEYHKKWVELAGLKQQYLVQKAKVENMQKNAPLFELLIEQEKLNNLELAYNSALTILNQIENSQKVTYQLLCDSFNAALQGLESIQKNLPESIKEITFEKIYTTEEALNSFKDDICEDFEKKYADDIANVKETMKNRKQELIDSLKSE